MHRYVLLIDCLAGLIFAAALAVAWYVPGLGDGWFSQVEKVGRRVAAKKGWVLLGVAVAAVGLRLSLLWLIPVPTPSGHDEFSYLLAADTFVHGRLTNPPHPMWVYLESFHINMQPTYMSKYPPAQGVILAVGKLLGHPWIGVLLSIAGMCAAITWMLQGWFPPVWAMLGGVIAVTNFAAFNYWTDEYWGGAAAAIGGALVMGALPRVWRRPGATNAVVLGLGVGIVANSRPFEGLIFCLPVAAAFAGWLWRRREQWRINLTRVVLPLAGVLGLTVVLMGYYNWRGTGNAWLFPYQVNERAYAIRPLFLWQTIGPPRHFLNPQFDKYYNHAQPYELEFMQAHFARSCWGRIKALSMFYMGVLVPVPVLTLRWLMRDGRMRLMLIQFALSLSVLLVVAPFTNHYFAPLTATLTAIVVQGLRHLRTWRHGGSAVGIGLSRLFLVLTLMTLPAHALKRIYEDHRGISWTDPEMPGRARIGDQLTNIAGKHLVLVRYERKHNVNYEWVYNAADIDHAKVVWAREIPGMDMTPLLRYYEGRRVWVVDADAVPAKLEPYGSGDITERINDTPATRKAQIK